MINEIAHYGYEFLIAVTVENPNPDIDNDIVGDKVRLAGLPRKLDDGTYSAWNISPKIFLTMISRTHELRWYV